MTDPLGEPARAAEVTRRLVATARAGDTQSFSALYERIAPALHTWAELRLRPGLRGRIEPTDIVQEVWCRAWRALPKLDPETPFRPWLFRIAKNVLLEAMRWLQGSGESPAAPGPSTRLLALENIPDDATAISLRVARNEELRAFSLLVQQLEEEERALVVHCGLEGLTYREVSNRLGITSDAVAKRWQRLRSKLAGRGLPMTFLADSQEA